VLLRDRPPATEEPNADGTLEERLYYLQNWRADVVLMAAADGSLEERIDYTAYGEPILELTADIDGDGNVDGGEFSDFGVAFGSTVGDPVSPAIPPSARSRTGSAFCPGCSRGSRPVRPSAW